SEEVSGQKSEECNCYRLPGSGRYRRSRMLPPCGSKTTRLCHSVCEECQGFLSFRTCDCRAGCGAKPLVPFCSAAHIEEVGLRFGITESADRVEMRRQDVHEHRSFAWGGFAECVRELTPHLYRGEISGKSHKKN